LGIGIGLVLGASLGMALGAAPGNLFIGIPFGMGVGIAMAVAFGRTGGGSNLPRGSPEEKVNGALGEWKDKGIRGINNFKQSASEDAGA
jgi:hypothetical protein